MFLMCLGYFLMAFRFFLLLMNISFFILLDFLNFLVCASVKYSPISWHFFQSSHILCLRLLASSIPSSLVCSFVRSRLRMSIWISQHMVYMNNLLIFSLMFVKSLDFSSFFSAYYVPSSPVRQKDNIPITLYLHFVHLTCVLMKCSYLLGDHFICCNTDLWKCGQVTLLSGTCSTHKDLSRELHCTGSGY